jgi:hypothetical protein
MLLNSWSLAQDAFIVSLKNPDLPNPPGMVGSKDRFNVYRNNVTVSLRDALGETFPVVKKLVGEEFFAGMAQAFVREHLPTTPVLMEYGGAFSRFIESFKPAEPLPYLADVARVEWAWLQAYHAADAVPIATDKLVEIEEEDLDDLRFETHPSLWLIESEWPVISIWLAHQGDQVPDLSVLPEGPQHGLIVRPNIDVQVHIISASASRLIDQLADDQLLGATFDAVADMPDADPSQDLAECFATGCVVGLVMS